MKMKMKSYNESDSENDSNGNNQSENSVYWCFDEASEYNGWVIKLDLTTPVKFQEKVIIIKKKKIKVMNMVKNDVEDNSEEGNKSDSDDASENKHK